MKKISIFFLSETFITGELVNCVSSDWDEPYYHTFCTSDVNGVSNGVSIFIKKTSILNFLIRKPVTMEENC